LSARATLAAVLAAAAALGLHPAPAAAELRALVVGIDAYEQVSDLAGAVNDARDISRSLGALGATDVTTLLDGAADKASLVRAKDAMMARASAGDTLVIAFAGHGSQTRERVKGSEADGLDEFYVLPGYSAQRRGESLYDDEMAAWLAEAGARGARVVLVVDTCHSGTPTRRPGGRARPRLRGLPEFAVGPEDLLRLGPGASAAPEESPHVSVFTAGQDREQIPEVRIEGSPRGALSYGFARALEGEADADGDGAVRHGELAAYLVRTVRLYAQSLQTPDARTGDPGDPVLFRVRDAAGTGAAAPDDPPRPLAVSVDPPDAKASAMLAEVAEAVEAAEGAGADLLWDRAGATVRLATGDVVAEAVGGTEDLRRVVGKWAALRRLEVPSRRSALDARLEPNDCTHGPGERIGFRFANAGGWSLTLVNLASDGTVQFLFPTRPADHRPPAPGEGSRVLRLAVAPPFGADHMVALQTPQPAAALHDALRRLDGKPEAIQAAEAVLAATGGGYRLAVQGAYTAREPGPCDR
jgi:hypothetical protein